MDSKDIIPFVPTLDDTERFWKYFEADSDNYDNKTVNEIMLQSMHEYAEDSNDVDYENKEYKELEIVAATPFDALVKAQKLYGDNALLLSTKKVEKSNLYSILIRTYEELTSTDEEVNQNSITDQEKKDALNASYELINHLFPKATNTLLPLKIDRISTIKLLENFSDFTKDQGDIMLPYFKKFKRNIEINKVYNVELFLFYGVIASIGYGVTLLNNRYGMRWSTVRKAITAVRMEPMKWNDKPSENINKLYHFAITYQPNKINQYAIKLLIDMGVSFTAISERMPTIKIDKSKNSHHYKDIVLPTPPIIIDT